MKKHLPWLPLYLIVLAAYACCLGLYLCSGLHLGLLGIWAIGLPPCMAAPQLWCIRAYLRREQGGPAGASLLLRLLACCLPQLLCLALFLALFASRGFLWLSALLLAAELAALAWLNTKATV